jgi:transcription-repair coupling factor (superfamily II helicase)
MTKRVGGEPLRDIPLLQWCEELLTSVVGAEARPASTVGA